MSGHGPEPGQGYPRVLHVIPSLRIGGTERQLVQLIRRSSRPERHQVALFDELGPLADQIPNPPVMFGPIGRDPRSYPANLRSVWKLRRIVRDLGVDLVHAHLGISEVLAALAVPRGIPIVASRRGRNRGFEERRWLRPVEGFGHRRTDVMICNSHFLAEHTRCSDLWPPPIEVIHNAVDVEAFAEAPMPAPDPPTVAVVANLSAHKGHPDFLHAFRSVVDALPTARAVLVGDGKERPRLAGLVSSLGLDDRVEFVGQVPDPRPHVARSHLVALTSLHEGFPNALLEAMAMGRPVVATGIGGIPELVRDGEDGYLTSRDPGELAERMLKLLQDEELRERMGRQARRRAEGFGWDRVVEETEALYARVGDRVAVAGRKR